MTRIELTSGHTGDLQKRISLNIDKIISVSELINWDEDDRKSQPHVHCYVTMPKYGSCSVSETYDEVMKKIEEAEEKEELKERERSNEKKKR